MYTKEKIKYDAEYISYIQHGESAAVFITRDVVKSIKTKGKWIDVLTVNGQMNDYGRWDFKSFTAELFPRKTQPVYPAYASAEEKKYITWQTAHADIANLRQKGYKGVKFEIFPKLINLNKGKYEIIRAIWNKAFNGWVPNIPEKYFTSSCEWRDRKVPIKPEWEYHILKIRRL
ncbi:MAG: hypothetical protein IJQ82_09475 [Selenomonadaceae bacterium]|nr:hypothetical protein [Selenomonadaceae bacterium]